jgi:hypothetical protein
MQGIIDSVLLMKLDVYRQFDTQDPDTGAIKKEWHYYKTLQCHAKGIISNSSTSRSGTNKFLAISILMNRSYKLEHQTG